MRYNKFLTIFFISLLILTIFWDDSYAEYRSSDICMYIFYDRECEDCHYIINEFLPDVLADYGERARIKFYEAVNLRNYELLIELEKAYEDMGNEFPIIVIGEYLLGCKEIESKLGNVLEIYSESGIPFQKPELTGGAQYTEEPVWVEGVGKDTIIDPELSKVYLAYFYEKGCRECDRAKYLFKYLRWKYPNIVVEEFNLEDKNGKRMAEALGELYNVPEVKRMTTPSVFVGQDYLTGEDVIEENLIEAIEKYRDFGTIPPWNKARKYLENAEMNIIERFRALGIITVVSAGLLDGINPCAFATIIFFISYLALVIKKKREIITVGCAFITAVFITYVLIGFGLLKFVQSLSFFPVIAKSVYILTAITALTFGVLSLHDYFKYRRGEYDKGILRLPDFIRDKIQKVVRKRMGVKKYVFGAFIVGFLISLLEFSCTGQVYLPTIVFVTRIPGLRMKALFYLALYNACFILPLLFIFFIVYRGMTAQRLLYLMRRRIKLVKLLTSILFFCLAGLLIYYIF